MRAPAWLLAAQLALPIAAPGLVLGAPSLAARLDGELKSQELSRRVRAAHELVTLDRDSARPLVLRALDDDAVAVRLAAMATIGPLDLQDLAPRLLEDATNPDAKIREGAVQTLGPLRGEPRRAVEDALERALADSELTVRSAALRGLQDRVQNSERRAHLLEAISACLTDEHPELRRAAAETLERIGDPFGVHALATRVDDPSPEVRLAVARAIGSLGDARAATTVLRLVDDNAEEVRAAAISTLGLLAADSAVPRLAPLLERPREPLAGPAAIALGRIAAAPGEDPTSKALRRRAGDVLVAAARAELNRAAALEGVRTSGAMAASLLTGLLPALGARPSDGALLVAGDLAAEGNGEVTRLLLDLAKLTPDGRFDAALVRARPVAGPVRDELVAWLAARLSDPGVAARRAAATALGALGDARAAVPLAAVLDDADASVKRDALLALVRTSSAAEPALLRAAQDGDHALARAAVSMLGQRHDEASRHALLEALSASDAATAMTAALALSDDAGARTLVQSLVALYESGLERARDPASVALLGPLRGHPDATVREHCLSLASGDGPGAGGALELLGAMRDAASADRLLRLVPRLSRRPLRRARLYAALGDLALAGDHVAGEKALVGALDDSDVGVRLSAAWALGKVNSRAFDHTDRALIAHLADPSGAVRANSLAALARRQRTLEPGLLARLTRDPDIAVRANALRLAPARAIGMDQPPLLRRVRTGSSIAPRGGPDYLLVRLARPSTAARVGLPDGLAVIFLADERGIVRDEGVPSGELLIELDEELLR